MPSNSQKSSKKVDKKPKSDAPVVPGVREIVVQGEANTEPTTTFSTVERNPETNEIIIN